MDSLKKSFVIMKAVGLILLLALISLIILYSNTQSLPPIPVSGPSSNFTPLPKALPPEIKKAKTRFTYVNFWASWCKPCLKELPFLNTYFTEKPEIEVLLINMDKNEDLSKAQEMKDKLAPILKSLFGIKAQVAIKTFAPEGLPHHVLIDHSNGNYKSLSGRVDNQEAIFKRWLQLSPE